MYIHAPGFRFLDLETKKGKQFAKTENVLPEKMKRNGEDFTKKENILSEMKGAGKREHFGPRRSRPKKRRWRRRNVLGRG